LASPQNTAPLVVVPHIESNVTIVVVGVALKTICRVTAMLANRTVDETSFGALERPQQNASPSVLRPHVASAAETAVSAGTALTRSGTVLHGVWTTTGDPGRIVIDVTSGRRS
jgi:hypothetical protein